VEIEEFPQAKEAIDVKVKDQNNVDLLFEHQGIIHFEFVPEGTTVNQTFHMKMLKRIIDAVWHKPKHWEHCKEFEGDCFENF
jgi:hypothetical protein